MSNICDDCNGLGITETDDVQETCDLCGGEGRI
jgi:DnaJ-class molecular chaperone